MSYFNSSFRKSFVGSKGTQASVANTTVALNNGFVIEAGVHTRSLSKSAAPYGLGAGTYGFFDPKTFKSVLTGVVGGKAVPLHLAAGSLMKDDKIGPFHGGYNEANKSKLINPLHINKFFKVVGAAAEQNIVHIGATNLDNIVAAITTGGTITTNGTFQDLPTAGGTGSGLTVDVTVAGGIITAVAVHDRGNGAYVSTDVLTIPTSAIAGYTATTAPTITLTVAPSCANFDFLCGETYNLRLDLYGSPVLRLLNHDAYRTLAAYTGCCANGAVPSAVDSTTVMINWAKQIMSDAFLKDFIQPIVYTEAGVKLDTLAAMEAYVPVAHVAGKVAGLRLVGAYIDTEFGVCSFQKSDFVEREIVRIKASLTDLTGLPCDFKGICVQEEFAGFAGQGFGRTVLKDVILDESYLQNHFHDDVRLRQINQGDQLFTAIPNVLYTRYVIQHVVPRRNNPSSVYDDDQYSLVIYVPTANGAATDFETFMAAWLTAAGQGVALETFAHTAFTAAAL